MEVKEDIRNKFKSKKKKKELARNTNTVFLFHSDFIRDYYRASWKRHLDNTIELTHIRQRVWVYQQTAFNLR